MRPIPLTVLRGGINRLRTKGGARADNLYDLINGHLTDAGTVKARPGTRLNATLPATTKGLVSFDGGLHTFSHETVTVPSGYTLHVLAHPNPPTGTTPEITTIHFVAPFLGFLYVVAEFEGGDIFHFWQRTSGEWTAATGYKAGDVVEPTTPNGINYEATRLGAPYPAWAASVPRALNDIIEPTVYNDFYYQVIEALGTNTISGTVEPDWSEEPGGLTYERADSQDGAASGPNSGPGSNNTPSGTQERYG